jgi:ribosome-associated protein
VNSRSLVKAIAKVALDKKAQELVVLDLRKLTTFTDFFVVCSGTSDRQVQTIASSVEAHLKKKERRPIGVEGYETGHWVLLDYGDVVAHIFYHTERDYYQLEKLWADAPRLDIKGITS